MSDCFIRHFAGISRKRRKKDDKCNCIYNEYRNNKDIRRDAWRADSLTGLCLGRGEKEAGDRNHIPSSVAVFTLQGSFDRQKLHGIYKLMINVMIKTAGKALSEKADRTPEEDEMLDLMLHGGSRVSVEHLAGPIRWYRNEQKQG